MQWLLNEFKQFKQDVMAKLDSAKMDGDLAVRVEKLEGEIRAMKARMGKNKDVLS